MIFYKKTNITMLITDVISTAKIMNYTEAEHRGVKKGSHKIKNNSRYKI